MLSAKIKNDFTFTFIVPCFTHCLLFLLCLVLHIFVNMRILAISLRALTEVSVAVTWQLYTAMGQ